MCTADGRAFGSVAEALRMANATMDYLNGPGAGNELDAASCGSVLRSLGEIEAKFTAAHASVLARFDAADAHDSDGYGTSAAWLMAMADMTRPDAKTKVWRMRLLRDHPEMAGALADADISKSQALAIAEWTKKLPAELRAETIRILVQAATAGASLDDLRMIAGDRAAAVARLAARRRRGRVRRPVRAGRHHVRRRGRDPRQPHPGMRRRRAGRAGGARQEGRLRRIPAPRASGSTTRCSRAVSC